MKDALKAIQIAEEFFDTPDDVGRDLLRHMRAAHRKTCRLELAAMEALKLLETMRYRTWPAGTSAALGICIDQFDEVMIELERAVYAGRRKTPKVKT